MAHFPPVRWPAATLTTLATYMLDWVFARGLKLRRVRLALAVPLAAWVAFVALAPDLAGRGFGELVAAVQPRSR